MVMFVILILICLVYSKNAYAYIEPTIASYLFQVAFLVFNGVFILLFVAPIRKIRSLAQGIMSKISFWKKS